VTRPAIRTSLQVISEPLNDLTPWYDETPAAEVMDPVNQPNWVAGNFGANIAHVRSVVTHITGGWPRRERARDFVRRYIDRTYNPPGHRGLGPQFLISGDGTCFRLINLPRRTGHATFVNEWALGVETGNAGDGTDLIGPRQPPNASWIQGSGDAEDIPGAKLWINREAGTDEVTPSWWTTASYAGPGRAVMGAGHMLVTEWQYRTWALLLRYLFEEFDLPRNFPLLPHRQRLDLMTDSVAFRRMVLADERADMMRRAFAAAPVNISSVNFEAANAAVLQTQYAAAVATPSGTKRHNRAWRAFFDHFRGVHGHGFSGAVHAGRSDHDCPGAVFDFHRLAREVSDYWWYPFDVAGGSAATARRPYRRFRIDTPLIEYFFDEDEGLRTARNAVGIHGNTSSPQTYRLEPRSPIYAMSNGELLAARFPAPADGVSLAFTLVRHEVFHQRLFPSMTFHGIPLLPGSIDHARPPSSVYTLYMHLGRAAGMTFDNVHDDNPDWLNRVLARQKECRIGVDFFDGHPTHHGIPEARWNNRPPGVPRRPTTLEAWRADLDATTVFVEALRRGDVAVMTSRADTQPIRVLLGDFLGESGVTLRVGGVSTHGVRVETFSRSFVAPTFSLVTNQNAWNPPAGLPGPPCLRYVSEWARIPTAAERAAMVTIGVNPDLLGWWPVVALLQLLDGTLTADARLPATGNVVHYRPIEFAKWLNQVTWASEWPKYEVTDAAGQPIPLLARRPTSRRI
jgi:hypothetical protein